MGSSFMEIHMYTTGLKLNMYVTVLKATCVYHIMVVKLDK